MGIRDTLSGLLNRSFGYSLPRYISGENDERDILMDSTYDWISEKTKVDHGRLRTYIDVEEMANSSDIECIAGDTKILSWDGRVSTISEMTESSASMFHVHSYDEDTNNIVRGLARSPRISGSSSIYEITLDHNFVIRCNEKHPFLLLDKSYCRAGNLEEGTHVVYSEIPNELSLYYPCKGRSKCITSIRIMGIEPVYDITIDKYHNFGIYIDNGIIFTHNTALQIYADDACVTVDTRIPLPDNRVLTIGDLIKEYGTGYFKVQSLDSGLKPVVGDARVFPSGKNKEIVKVTIEDPDTGKLTHIRCTPDHRFMLRDGTYSEIQNLDVGDSLMPYLTHEDGGYINIYDPSNDSYGRRYKYYHDSYNGECRTGRHIHHDLFNENNKHPSRLNDDPDFLVDIDPVGHFKLHLKNNGREALIKFNKSDEKKAMRKKYLADPVWNANRRKGMRLTQHNRFHHDKNIIKAGCELCNEIKLTNHTIVSIIQDGYADTYDMSVDKYHNFATDAGVYIHNTQIDVNSNRSIWAVSTEPKVQDAINGMFDDLKIEESIWGYARSVAQYGDMFLRTYSQKDVGVTHLAYVNPKYVNRIEDKHSVLINYRMSNTISGKTGSGADFTPWEITHFKTPGQYIDRSYGEALIGPARNIWKQLKMMEDAVMLYRIRHAPDRMLYKIDIGTRTSEESFALLNRFKLFNRRKSFIDPTTGSFRTKNNPLCLTGDTKISLLNGTEVAIKDLVGKEEFWVYAYDIKNKKIVPGRGHSARLTKKNAKIVSITIDNGEETRCTPDHRFLMRDGTYKEAQDLKPGDSLMPLYRRKSSCADGELDSYDMCHAGDGHYKYTHRITSELSKNNSCEVCNNKDKPNHDHGFRHHKDFNKLNNDPDNFAWLTWKEHYTLHAEHGRKNLIKYNGSDKHKSDVRRYNAKNRVQKSAIMIKYNKSDAHRLAAAKVGKTYGAAAFRKDARSEIGRKRRSDTLSRLWKEGKMKDKKPSWNALCKVCCDICRDGQEYTGIAFNAHRMKHEPRIICDMCGNKYMHRKLSNHVKIIHNGRSHNDHIKNDKVDLKNCYSCNEFAMTQDKRINDMEMQYNHRVISVYGLDKCEDVYDITVDKWHNFALSACFYVHNSIDEDIYFPVKSGSNSDVTRLQGSANVDSIMDLEFMQSKLYASLKIPPGYMGKDQEGYRGDSTLAQQDIRYARTIRRLQRSLILGCRRICDIHLVLNGFDLNEIDYSVVMSNVSNLDELEEVEILKAKLGAAKELADIVGSLAPNNTSILKHIFSTVLSLPAEVVTSIIADVEENPQKDGTEESSSKSTLIKSLNESRIVIPSDIRSHARQDKLPVNLTKPE